MSYYDDNRAPQGDAVCRLARLTSSNSLLSAGFWKKAVAPASPGIDTVSQPFQITATEATHREYIRTQVKTPDTPGERSPGTDPAVSAEDFSVPTKAREEFAKGMEVHAEGDDQAAQASLERTLEIYPSYVFAPKFAPGYVSAMSKSCLVRLNGSDYRELRLAILERDADDVRCAGRTEIWKFAISNSAVA